MPMAGCHKSRGKYIVTGEKFLDARKSLFYFSRDGTCFENGATPAFYSAWRPNDVTHVVKVLFRVLRNEHRRSAIVLTKPRYIAL